MMNKIRTPTVTAFVFSIQSKGPQMAKEKKDKQIQELRLVKGVGQKSAEILTKSGICSLRTLASCPSEVLKKILENQLHVNSSSWPKKARKIIERNTFVLPGDIEIASEFEERETELRIQLLSAESAAKSLRQILDDSYGIITGIGVGLRTKAGRITSPLTYVVIVDVEYKMHEAELTSDKIKLIPNEYRGTVVKVMESAPSYASNTINPDDPSHVVGGQKISATKKINGKFNSGTLGIAVPIKGQKFVGLANQHFAKKGQEIIQPPQDPISPEMKLGKVTKSSNISTPGVDGSIFPIENEMRQFIDGVIGFEKNAKFYFASARLFASDVGAKAYIFGAKTGRKRVGRIVSRSMDKLKIGGKSYNDIIKVTSQQSFIRKGDSGSVLILDISQSGSNKNYLVGGLFFARSKNSTKVGYACHFSNVAKKLKLKIPSGKLKSNWKSNKH